MGTLYPTERERRAIQKSADQGDESARDYLDLLNACTQVLEGSNGVSLARAFVGEHDDVYGQSVDDALSELMPVIFRVSAGGWDSLKFYVPEEMQREAQESMDRLKQAVAHSEALKWLKLTLEEDKEEIEEMLWGNYIEGSLEDPPSRAEFDALLPMLYEALRDDTELPEMAQDVKRAFAQYLESWDKTVGTSLPARYTDDAEEEEENFEEDSYELTEEAKNHVDEAASDVVAAWQALRQRLA